MPRAAFPKPSTSNRRMAQIPSGSWTTRSMPMWPGKACSLLTGQSRRRTVGGGLNLCFPDLHLRHFNRIRLIESLLHLFADINRYVFSRWIYRRKRLDVVKKDMVQWLRDSAQQLLQVDEVGQQSRIVQLFTAHDYLNLVIMPGHVLALALVMPQGMASRECVFDRNLKHVKTHTQNPQTSKNLSTSRNCIENA